MCTAHLSVNMKTTFSISKYLPICLFSIIGAWSHDDIQAASLRFSGDSHPVMTISPDKSTGLEEVYVVYDTSNFSISYEASSNNSNVKWYSFSNLGAAFASPIENIEVSDNIYTLNDIIPDSGYVIEEGEKRYYFWIVNYANKRFSVSSLTSSDLQNCESTIIDFIGEAQPIYYYTINGRSEILTRDISLSYQSLEYDSETQQYVQNDYLKSLASVQSSINIIPPIYCSTEFTITGDKFLRFWNEQISYTSTTFSPTAVQVKTDAAQEESFTDDSQASNLVPSDTDGLGGSAPCTIDFSSSVTDAVIHNEWQMATDEEFNDITYRINEQDFTYTFTEEGTVFVRFIGSNSDGSCEAIGDTYTVNIGASILEIPNAFSPNGDGINDEWKVSYRSLTHFKCWIFDRQGHQLYQFDDPSKGWDGKHNGKIVKPGVYFYVIEATGSDGKRYKRSGDINIISYKSSNSSNNIIQ